MTAVGLPQWIVLAVAAQRVGELIYARRNTARLLARGGQELGSGHYPLLVALHAGWLLAVFVLTPPAAPPSWPLLGLFLALQVARLWVIAALGPYWTTRVITLPGAPLVRRGPYRWMRHPNYAIVAAEIAMLPLAFGQWQIAAVASVLNALVLGIRIRVEEAALEGRRPAAADSARRSARDP